MFHGIPIPTKLDIFTFKTENYLDIYDFYDMIWYKYIHNKNIYIYLDKQDKQENPDAPLYIKTYKTGYIYLQNWIYLPTKLRII